MHFTSHVPFTFFLHFQTRKSMNVSDLSVNVSKLILNYMFQLTWTFSSS